MSTLLTSQALALDNPALVLRSAVEHELTAHNRSRDDLLGELNSLRATVRESDRPELEDAVLDVMDMLDGWCGPGARL